MGDADFGPTDANRVAALSADHAARRPATMNMTSRARTVLETLDDSADQPKE